MGRRQGEGGKIPFYIGGASDAAIAVAGRHVGIHVLWGETHAHVRASVAKYGRNPRLRLSLRPILAETGGAGARESDLTASQGDPCQDPTCRAPSRWPQRRGGCLRRLLKARLDKRLWTARRREWSANTTALVGTPEQVAGALSDYYDLGKLRS
jgi:alkanesulfonate monooxygenase